MEKISQFVAQHAIRLQSKNVDRNVSSALRHPCPSTVSFSLDFGHLREGDTLHTAVYDAVVKCCVMDAAHGWRRYLYSELYSAAQHRSKVV